jgi:hypothetical protein
VTIFYINKNYLLFMFLFDFSQLIENLATTRGVIN